MTLKIRRLLAVYIDFITAVVVSTVVTNIVTLGNFNAPRSFFMQILSIVIYLLLVISYIVIKDILFKSASLGKKILGIKIIDDNGSDVLKRKILIKRNLENLIVFPLYIIDVLLNNQSKGDKKYKTKVININKS